MMRISKAARMLAVITTAVTAQALVPVTAVANPAPTGTLQPLPLQGGGTLGGSMALNAAGTGLASWSFEVTAGTYGGFNFTDFVYDTSNSVARFTPLLVFGGKRLTTLDIRTTDYPGTSGSHDMGLIFEEIPSTIPGAGLLLSVCGATLNCLDTGSGIALESGEGISNPTPGNPFGVARRNITGGYLTVSDPPGSISLNFTADPVLIPVSGGGGGTVPEPATLGLAGLGLALALYVPRRRRHPM